MEPRAENWARAQFHYLLDGKPAGVRCAQLDDELRCRIFGRPECPAVCSSLAPQEEMCGSSREQALRWLGWMEEQTAPHPPELPDQPG